MSKLLALVATLLLTASLSAVNIKWQFPSGFGHDWMTDAITDGSFAFVYSQTEVVAKEISNGVNNSAYTTPSDTWKTFATAAANGTGDYTFTTDQKWTSSGATAEFDLSSTAAGYYYLVVFKTSGTEGSLTVDDYAVIGGVKYQTGGGAGIYDDTVDGTTPEFGNFVDLSTLTGLYGGMIVSTPEPTVLALLALGVAGLALRRKNF